MSSNYDPLFDLAPVSLWLEDFSAVTDRFDALRQAGVRDFVEYARANPAIINECMSSIRVVNVNRRTLSLFGARDLAHLNANLHLIFREERSELHLLELNAIWRGETEFCSDSSNYTLDGRCLDIRLRGQVLPGHEARWDLALISVEDFTERATIERDLRASERYAQGLFQHSPVSLWVEDFSAIRMLLDEVRGGGITDFRTFLNVHPDFVSRCMEEIRVIEVNQQTLTLFGAPNQDVLLSRLGDVFRDEMRPHFAEQLIDLWQERLWQQREIVNYGLDGRVINLHMQWSVFPGHESTWDRVLVSLTDITSRKKAEAYLEFLGKHDVLTKLYNRGYYEDELARLDRKGPWPVSLIAVDLNGLKRVNDSAGHAAGDALLRRAGEVLKQAAGAGACVARTGGDEFMVLLTAHDAEAVKDTVAQIAKVTALNNQFYPGDKLSLSIGAATGHPGQRLEAVARLADERMYAAKRQYYENSSLDRREASNTPVSSDGVIVNA